MFSRLKLKQELNKLFKKRDELIKQISFNMWFSLGMTKYANVSHEVSSVEWELYDVNNRILEINKKLNKKKD